MTSSPFGRVLTAMVTPMSPDGEVDADGVDSLVDHLLATGHDGIVVNGTTGESATLTEDESIEMVRRVKERVGDRAAVVAGVGSNDTRHAVHMAGRAARVGADALLLVSPYYNKPTQPGVVAHCRAVADTTELPLMLYDIPGRTGIPFTTSTLLTLAEHPRIVAVKDAKGDLTASARVMAATDLAYYAGDDSMTLPLMAVGGVGLVGTSTHFTGRRTKGWMDAWLAGRRDEALEAYRALLGVYTGVFATQGCMLVKAGLAARGFADSDLRRPLKRASEEESAAFVALLDAAGL